MKLGVEDVVKISAARQAYGCAKPRFEPNQLSLDLVDIFRLEGCFEAPSVGTAEDEDAAIKVLEDEVSDAQAACIALPTPPAREHCAIWPSRAYGSGARCAWCAKSCHSHSLPEAEEHRLRREDKEEKERRLKDLTDKRQQRQLELDTKQERMALFRSSNLVI